MEIMIPNKVARFYGPRCICGDADRNKPRLIAVASQSQTVTLNAVDSSTYTDNGGKLT